MKNYQRLVCLAMCMTVVLPLTFIGCRDEGGDMSPLPAGTTEEQYEVNGKVVAVDPDAKTVTLDHEDIPGLMKGMEMEFAVENPAVLKGLAAGDQVQGRLVVKDGDYIITELKKP